MKKLKNRIIVLCVLFLLSFVVLSCSKSKEKVVIYTSTEDFNIKHLQECLSREFSDYNIVIEYMSTSNIAAKIIEEGGSSDCDIVYDEDYGYLEKMAQKGVLDSIKGDYDLSKYLDDTLVDSLRDYSVPTIKTGGGIIINRSVLSSRGLKVPTSYSDLLAPEYKGLISMPSPKSSSTGYMFYYSLIKAWGEERALDYFEKLTPNILSYTTSGSGPVNSVVNREVAVGFGMTSQAVTKINEGNDEISIIFFKEGSPFSVYGNAIVKGKKDRKAVKDVMDYLEAYYTDESNSLYYPETVLKDKKYLIDNFPDNIKYADMTGNNLDTKEKHLSKWMY